MPLVFVHGVANRQSLKHQAEIYQRDKLFKKFLLPSGAAVFDPDWGSHAVSFDPNMPWLPCCGGAEQFAVGEDAEAGNAEIGRLASKQPDDAIDLVFEAGLEEQAEAAAQNRSPDAALTDEKLEIFAAAVRYLEDGADKDVFDSEGSDSDFLDVLAMELGRHLPPAQGTKREEMSVHGKLLGWIGTGVKKVISPIRNAGSTSLLLLVRQRISARTALFLGDIFVYLRWREAAGVGDGTNRIFAPIINDLIAAASLRRKGDPLIVVGHSLGGVTSMTS
jgi:hypothetical protein